METQTDSALMKSVQEGDTAQLAILFERYYAPLFRYLLALTRERALSEDLTQEVFFRVLKYARSYDTGLSFPVWLYGMARNAHWDARHKRRGESPVPESMDIKSLDPLPEELAVKEQDARFLREALDALPEPKREVLVLSRYHNLRYEEIAKILDCEINTVKVRVYRALKELREKFCQLRGDKIYEV